MATKDQVTTKQEQTARRLMKWRISRGLAEDWPTKCSIGDLRRIRAMIGITQEAMARRLEVGIGRYNGWETGRTPCPYTAAEITQKLWELDQKLRNMGGPNR